MKFSINTRMLIAASVILAAFLGITGVTLESSYVASAEDAFKERLRAHVTALIASSDISEKGKLQVVYALPEPRLFTPGSGLYGKILSNDGKVLWSSPSLDGVTLPVKAGLRRGESRFQRLSSSNNESVMSYSLGIAWSDEASSKGSGYTFVVAESMGRHQQQLADFLHNLWGWLAGVALVLLVMLGLILRWGLSPLRTVAEDLNEIRSGRAQMLEGEYPAELKGLTSSLNSLIQSNREHEERYRSSLGDLAHSLKTPLAVLRGLVGTPNPNLENIQATLNEQVQRMDQIVHYQLNRAATSSRTALVAPVDVAGVLGKIMNAMHKVYADKAVVSDVQITLQDAFHCQEDDLMEILGNIVDNAFKWCYQRVEVEIAQQQNELRIQVADDGAGINEDDIATVLARGGRLDEQTTGHGLGMAMVKGVVDLYGGSLSIGRSHLGGARVEIHLPWR